MSFQGVIGQEQAVAALEAHLRRTGGAGSTLLVGPDGVGRFLLALRAAGAILGSRARVDALQHPDLVLLEPDEGIDGVRSVWERLARVPAEGPRQVLILRDADRLHIDALNALLKTLEEPPADAAIFVIAEGPEFLPETVVSRCRLVRARRLTTAECAKVLAGLGLPPESAEDADGSPGRAVFHAQHGIGEDASRVCALLERSSASGLGEVEKLARSRSSEDRAAQRRRLTETLRVAAARLRRELPGSENRLRSVVGALRSLGRNANPGIVLTELALKPWKKAPNRQSRS